MRAGFCICVCVASLLLCVGGCGQSTVDISDPRESNLGTIAQMYGTYRNRNRGQVPKNEQELRQFISDSEQPGDDFGDMNELFVSDRNGQPYVILFGKDVIRSPQGVVVGHESSATDGKIYVGYQDGLVEVMDEESFEAMKGGRRK